MSKRSNRSPGEGSIYLTKDGRYLGSIHVTDPRTGQDVRRYVTGRSRAEVSRKLARLKADAAAGSIPSSITMREYLSQGRTKRSRTNEASEGAQPVDGSCWAG